MKYLVKRQEDTFGPYALEELKRYVAEGRIAPDDLAQSEGMDEWAPVSSVVGDIELAAPVASLSIGSLVDEGTVEIPRAPNLHWAWVLVLSWVTCGLFNFVWCFVQANWVKKFDPDNTPTILFAVYVAAMLAVNIVPFIGNEDLAAVSGLAAIAGIVCFVVGYFKLKGSVEAYFNRPLSGPMTFFFNIIYLQYHFNDINKG